MKLPAGTPLGPCPLCGRPMLSGPSVDRHHWIPRAEGGVQADWIHVVCHRMIHRLFDEATLARAHPTADSLSVHPDMDRFLHWVRRKPADYVDWPETPIRHGKNRGRSPRGGR